MHFLLIRSGSRDIPTLFIANKLRATTKSNVVNTKDHKFEIKYVNSGGTTHFSLDVTFPFEDRTLHWTPKPLRYDPVRDKFFLNFRGEYHHTPVLSTKNTVLQNDNGHVTMIIRKMSPTVYEVECLPVVDKLTVFAIGLSEIVGPYFDPWMGDYYE
ncbi:hypothetical protein M9Y10_038546 [Tritrichomonas musculus]|uniref:Uncharacterized protein n=1 Tax=Tritrichomonas musculus TaxID=1915356 RepID=A0ABR2K8P4_9EUKA